MAALRGWASNTSPIQNISGLTQRLADRFVAG
jgi:hypothetical protein